MLCFKSAGLITAHPLLCATLSPSDSSASLSMRLVMTEKWLVRSLHHSVRVELRKEASVFCSEAWTNFELPRVCVTDIAAIKSGLSSLCFSHLRSIYHSSSLFTDPFKFASFTPCSPSQFCEYVSVADCMLTTPACSGRCLLYTVVWMLE